MVNSKALSSHKKVPSPCLSQQGTPDEDGMVGDVAVDGGTPI